MVIPLPPEPPKSRDINEFGNSKSIGWYFKFAFCKIFDHHIWTSKAIRREKLVSTGDYAKDLVEYAKVYCEICGHESKLNIKLGK